MSDEDNIPTETMEHLQNESKDATPIPQDVKNKQLGKLRLHLMSKKGIIVASIAALLAIVALMLFVPNLRDLTVGRLVQKQLQVRVIDDRSGKAISGARVSINSVSAETNADGVATLSSVSAVAETIHIDKPYYRGSEMTYRVPFFGKPSAQSIKLHATGETITFTFTDAITKTLLAGATITSGDTNATTDSKGQTTLVLPYSDKEQSIIIKKEGYNQKALTVKTDEGKSSDSKQLALTPQGKVLYLSKETGVIDVMQANLDGSGQTVVKNGDGTENDSLTTLLSSRDWKYSALWVVKDNSQELYLVDATTKKVTLVDDGDINFSLKGWSGHKFIYTINRNNREYWQDKIQALKAYDADKLKLTQIDETTGSIDQYGYFTNQWYVDAYIVDNDIVYIKQQNFGSKYEYGSYFGSGRGAITITSVNPDSLTKKLIKSFNQDPSDRINSRLYEPQGVYLQYVPHNSTSDATYYEYEDGKVTRLSGSTAALFSKDYPTYLISPSGEKSFWYEQRNGKNTLFIGDKEGKNGKQVANLSNYKPYGWYGDRDQYVLVTKDGSVLYVADPIKLADAKYQPVEISTIHKPLDLYSAYGYGYGGQ